MVNWCQLAPRKELDMNKVKITQDQFNELCSCGKIKSSRYAIYLINWLTYFDLIAVYEENSINGEEYQLVRLEIIDKN